MTTGSALNIAKERRELAREIQKTKEAAEASGATLALADEADKEYLWSRRLMESERDAGANNEERRTAFEGHIKRMQILEEREKTLFESGKHKEPDWLSAKLYRLEAEYWLATALAVSADKPK